MDLPADDEVGRRVDVVLRHVGPVTILHLPKRVAEQSCDVEHRRRIPQVVLVVAADARLLLDDVDRVLRDRQISRREHDDDPVCVACEDTHLGKTGDVIDAGVRAGVRREDHARVK